MLRSEFAEKEDPSDNSNEKAENNGSKLDAEDAAKHVKEQIRINQELAVEALQWLFTMGCKRLSKKGCNPGKHVWSRRIAEYSGFTSTS